MTYAYRCDKTGLIEFCDGPDAICPVCGTNHSTWSCGLPPPEAGGANVIGDRLKPYMDWGAGCIIDSKSQRRRLYEQKGLRLKGVAEHRRQHGGFERPSAICSYSGQKFRGMHKDGVRTSTGERII